MNHAQIPARPMLRSAAVAVRQARLDPLDMARSMIVLGCALALIMAGQSLPL